jgi:putative membrane protein
MSASGSGQLSAADRRFIETAARGGMAEVELGRLGTQKATGPEVKALAQMMVDDHSKANDELKTLASQKGVTLPTDTDAKHKSLTDRLDKLSGEQFDKTFTEEVLKDHKKDVAEFQREAKASGGDSDVKSWASKTLPTLEQHLQHAQQASSMGMGAAGTSATSTDSSKSDKKKTNPPPDSHPR